MYYILELRDESNLPVHDEEEYCTFESDTPIPVPRVGDRVRFAECKDHRKMLMIVTFVEFNFYPADPETNRDAKAYATVYLVPEGQPSRFETARREGKIVVPGHPSDSPTSEHGTT